MSNLQELIDTANTLSKNLEIAAYNEMKYSVNICIRLEQISWEIYRHASELNEIRQNIC